MTIASSTNWGSSGTAAEGARRQPEGVSLNSRDESR